jgi:hypothetical protein
MQPVDLHGNWRDIPNAGRRALSARKLALHARGVFLAYLILVVLFYAGSMLSSIPFGAVWNEYGLSLLQMLFRDPPSRLAFAGVVVAALATILISVHYGTAVSRLTYAQLRGDYFYTTRSALAFANRHAWEAAQAVAFFVVVVAAIRLFAFLAGALGRIPVVGEWMAAIGSLFLVPAYIAGLAMSLFTVLIGFALLLSPSIVGVVGANVVETTYQLFTTLWNQPWRLLGYTLLVFLTQCVALATLYAMSAWGFFMLLDAAAVGYPPLEDAFQTAAHIVWGGQLPVGQGLGWRFVRTNGLSPAMNVTVVFATLSFLAVTVAWLSYGLCIASVGTTLTYINLRRRIRGDNVLTITPEVLSDDADASRAKGRTSSSGTASTASEPITESTRTDDGTDREPADVSRDEPMR